MGVFRLLAANFRLSQFERPLLGTPTGGFGSAAVVHALHGRRRRATGRFRPKTGQSLPAPGFLQIRHSPRLNDDGGTVASTFVKAADCDAATGLAPGLALPVAFALSCLREERGRGEWIGHETVMRRWPGELPTGPSDVLPQQGALLRGDQLRLFRTAAVVGIDDHQAQGRRLGELDRIGGDVDDLEAVGIDR